MGHPDGLPDLFIDRSLGKNQVPTILRAAGLRLESLAERYGVPADERISDDQWLEDIGALRWVVFMKDKHIRYNESEKALVLAHNIRCFCLTRSDIAAREMANCFLDNLPAITSACQQSGPFIYAVQKNCIVKLTISPPIPSRSPT